MDTTVGSGRVITMPVITEDGQPIENPNSDGGAAGSEQQNNGAPLPKEVIDWKLTLHQIGKHCCSFFSISYIYHGLPRAFRQGGGKRQRALPRKPAYSVMICNSACAWDKEVASLHLGCPNVPSNRPGIIRPMTGVYNFYLSIFPLFNCRS